MLRNEGPDTTKRAVPPATPEQVLSERRTRPGSEPVRTLLFEQHAEAHFPMPDWYSASSHPNLQEVMQRPEARAWQAEALRHREQTIETAIMTERIKPIPEPAEYTLLYVLLMGRDETKRTFESTPQGWRSAYYAPETIDYCLRAGWIETYEGWTFVVYGEVPEDKGVFLVTEEGRRALLRYVAAGREHRLIDPFCLPSEGCCEVAPAP